MRKFLCVAIALVFIFSVIANVVPVGTAQAAPAEKVAPTSVEAQKDNPDCNPPVAESDYEWYSDEIVNEPGDRKTDNRHRYRHFACSHRLRSSRFNGKSH